MRRVERLIIIIPIGFTLFVAWFSWSAFQIAPQMAAESLRSAGLSISAAIEELTNVTHNPGSLTGYSTPDIAYFSVTSRQGIVKFHTNSRLIGTAGTETIRKMAPNSGIYEERRKLGTGEVIYLLQTRIHQSDSNCLLTLALHTYRADQIIRRAQTAVAVSTLLTLTLWIVTLVLMLLLRRDKMRQIEMQRREELARLGEMGAVMAHEIRNPLSGIKGFAQLIEEGVDTDQSRSYAKKIVQQSLRMETLVDELLSFASENNSERQSADLSVLVRDCVNMISMEADTSGVSVVYTPPPPLKIKVLSDRITQLLLNLLKNGLQAMPSGGKLRVEVEKRKNQAIIKVIDSGIGILPENIPHIFEPFWTNKARGTGLGLALCRKVAQEHGGNLVVESAVGVGTTFTLTLPMEC